MNTQLWLPAYFLVEEIASFAHSMIWGGFIVYLADARIPCIVQHSACVDDIRRQPDMPDSSSLRLHSKTTLKYFFSPLRRPAGAH